MGSPAKAEKAISPLKIKLYSDEKSDYIYLFYFSFNNYRYAKGTDTTSCDFQ